MAPLKTSRVHYEASNFPPHRGSSLSGNHVISCSPTEVYWAAVTVGRRSFQHVIKHGLHSRFEIVYRIAMIDAYLTNDASSNIIQSPAFKDLDPSEKGATSYYFGLAFTKLLAHRLFNVPWLLHIDNYKHLFKLVSRPVKAGKKGERPDLIGLDASLNWLIFEAKGRSYSIESGLLAKAKIQTRNIRSINGQFPSLRVASATLIAKKSPLTVFLEDPESFNDWAIDVEGPDIDFIRDYYRLIMDFLRGTPTENITFDGTEYTCARMPEFSLGVGLQTRLFQALEADRLDIGLMRAIMETRNTPERTEQTPDRFVGSDRIVVFTSVDTSSEAQGRTQSTTQEAPRTGA